MGYILCTAEKPSVAADIARVIGATKKCNGYYEGNGYRVTWAVGHLVGLAEPEAYGYMSQKDMWDKGKPQNRQLALKELPLIPDEFKLIVLESTKEQYAIVKNLMNDPECDSIIDCGDAGPEGHILQWFIRQKAGCRKPVKRFIATSMTEEAILAAMDDLQDVDKYMPVIKGEYCKKKLDWIMGMSMSRGASITYNARVDVGRVQSPTLYFVVKRYLDVASFKQKDFYTLKATNTPGNFNVFWKKDSQHLLEAGILDEENRLVDKQAAEKIAGQLRSFSAGEVTVFETKNKSTDRPQLYDITELERDGNRLYGYTAEEVLNTAQSLYERHKITTYPRTDSRYITHDLAPFMENYISKISTYPKYGDVCKEVLSHPLNLDNRLVDDSKVTDHHAIMVTDKIGSYDLLQLSEMEKNVLDLIITRMLVAVSDKYRYKETTLKIKFPNGMIFGASGTIPVSFGWKEIQSKLSGAENKEESPKEEQIFPELQVGQTVKMDCITVVPQKTVPPKLHTEATLLTAMENAGNSIEGGAILKGRGIGTQATRAGIIKQLFDKGYIANQQKGKIKYLVPTKQGISVIKVLPPDLYSPKITADWENQIAEIANGSLSENEFLEKSKDFLKDKLNLILNRKVEGVDFSVEKEIFGKCPWCKSPVYEGTFTDNKDKKVSSVYCSNKECRFSIRKDNLLFKMRTGRNLTDAQLKKLVAGEPLEVKCVSKTNTTYKGIFSVKKNDKGYADLVFNMPTIRPKSH